MAAVTVGGTGAALSSAAVFAVANGLSDVSIDSSALSKLSGSSKHHVPPPSSPELLAAALETTPNASLVPSRAALLVLLNKLLTSNSLRRPHLPQSIVVALQDPAGAVDVSALVAAATNDEKDVLDAFADFSAAIAAVALADFSAAALAPALDAVAAMSCEVLGAGAAQFDCPDSGDGFSNKDVTDVGSDLKDLLLNSKCVSTNRRDSRPEVARIPDIHGSFRSGARSAHKAARVELNSKTSVAPAALLGFVSQLVIAIKEVGEMSFERCERIVDAIEGELRSDVSDSFQNHCDNARQKIRSLYTKVFVEFTGSSTPLLEIYNVLDFLRRLLAWEAALDLFYLDLNSDDFRNEDNADVGNDNKKKKKKGKILGEEVV